MPSNTQSSNDSPPITSLPFVVIDARGRPFFDIMRELVQYRDLLWYLAWRDITIRYKQSIFGFAWVVLQPFMMMLTFTVFLGLLIRVPSDGIPYPVFVFSGLIAWQMFTSALVKTSGCLLANAGMIGKIYFPRLVIPLSSVLPCLMDFTYAAGMCLVMMLYFKQYPSLPLLALPVYVLLALIIALGTGLWLAVLTLRYRDFEHLLPVVIQIWMYTCPIMYPVSLVPEKWRWLYELNPMVNVIDGVRWSFFAQGPPPNILLPALFALGVLASGVRYFRRNESRFADYM